MSLPKEAMKIIRMTIWITRSGRINRKLRIVPCLGSPLPLRDHFAMSETGVITTTMMTMSRLGKTTKLWCEIEGRT